MKIRINENFLKIKESYLFSDINKKVKVYQAKNPNAKIIRLGIGDVTLPLPKIVVDKMQEAVLEMGVKVTFRGYPPEYGYDFLKEAIKKYYKRYNVELELAEIFVSDGAKSDIGNLVDIFGDNEIYIPDPVYPVYVDSNTMSGRNIHYLDANKDNGFLPTPEGQNFKNGIIYICSPNNPTGALYDYVGLKEWVDYALYNDSLIIYDSAYEAFIEGAYPHTIYEIEGAKKCAIEVCSLSKSAGFTGTRCGYTIIPLELNVDGVSINKLWSRRQATKFNGVSYPVQRAAEAALSAEGIEACSENIKYYKRNAKLIADLMKEKEIYFTGGINSPYIWMRCPNDMDSWDFFDYLLKNANIVGTPGAGFGENGNKYFRLTSFATYEATLEALERLRKLL